MENAEIVEAPEVADIDGQQLPHAMDIHARREPGIMDLHALDIVRDEKLPPAIVDLPAVRQQLEIPLDHTGQAVRLGDAQTEAVLVERAGGGVPELGQGLLGVAEPHPLPDQRAKRVADCGMLRVIAFADPQQDIAVEQTGVAARHQS